MLASRAGVLDFVGRRVDVYALVIATNTVALSVVYQNSETSHGLTESST